MSRKRASFTLRTRSPIPKPSGSRRSGIYEILRCFLFKLSKNSTNTQGTFVFLR